MNPFKSLAEKPWLDESATLTEQRASWVTASQAANQRVALMCFLAIVGMLFFLFFAAYHMRLDPVEVTGRPADWVPMPEPPLLWFNTLVLILASGAYEWARRLARRDDLKQAWVALLLAGGATFAFLVLQLMVWNDLAARGYYARANPANAFFYLITAVHGVHLLGGLVAWARAARRLAQPREASERAPQSIELCAIYWHFLLLVWLGMLALFANT